MIIGIIKNNKVIKGECHIKNVEISHNIFKTVTCNNVSASSKDRIIFICDTCLKESHLNKRIFCEKNNFDCLCRNCRVKKTSLKKYGVESPNQSALIKEKQHKDSKRSEPFVNGNEYQPRKTNSIEELCELRRLNTTKKWEDGDYNDVDYSISAKKKWENPEFREKMRIAQSSEDYKNLQSENGKKRWEDNDYRERVCKNLKISINSNPEELKRRSDFQKQRWEENPEKMFESLNKCIKNRFSKLHIKITNELKLREKGFIGEQKIGRYLVDEFNKKTNTIVEINGDYIHANPKIYEKDDIIKLPGNSYTAEEKWESDKIKIEKLKSLGYNVIVIWESDDLSNIII